MVKKLRTFSLLVLCLCISGISQAQKEKINTDRPDQSDGIYTVSKGSFQLENGLMIADRVFENNLLLRYGVGRTTELRLLVDAGKEQDNKGVNPITFSVKQRIVQQRNILPAISFSGYLSYGKLASKEFQSDTWGSELTLAFENEITDRFTLGYNVGTTHRFDNLILTAGLGYDATEKVSAYLEYFSTIASTLSEHNIDAGLLYLVHPQMQLDIAVGHSLFASEDRLFTTFGISYRFDK
ncbi:MAG: transporter [Chitinophagaceae bacterium]|nr:transporter [Chitinophagaceae bacterium]